jgi:hypothetical protein
MPTAASPSGFDKRLFFKRNAKIFVRCPVRALARIAYNWAKSAYNLGSDLF